MDFFFSSADHRGTDLLHNVGGLLGAPVPREQLYDAKPEGLCESENLFKHGEHPLSSHPNKDCRPMQNVINHTSQFSASPHSRFASIFSAQHHQISDSFTSTAIPLLSSYATVSNKENHSLHSGCYSPTVSCTYHYQLHGRTNSFSSSTTLLGSPFSSKALASPSNPSTPIKYEGSKATMHLSPASHFQDGPLAFIKDLDSPFSNRCLSALFSSDPDLSPVIRAGSVFPPCAQSSAQPVNAKDNCTPITKRLEPATPGVDAPVGLSKRTTGSLLSRLPSSKPLRSREVVSASNDIHDAHSDVCSASTPSTYFNLSPLTPLSPCSSLDRSSNLANCKRRSVEIRDRFSSPSPVPRKKRRCCRLDYTESSSPPPNAVSDAMMDAMPRPCYTIRSFHDIEVSLDFPLFYRRHPLSSYFQIEGAQSPCSLFCVKHPGGNYNPPRSPFDLYTPRFVKGKGTQKVGLCPICIESHIRGGEGKALWLAMKFSAFKCYHMQYSHGISAATGLPFSPPVAFRTVNRPNPGKKEKATIRQGKCHKCHKWVPIEGIKAMETKVKEIYWWKHAAACHQASATRNDDAYEKDYVYEKLSGY